jgi:carbamoyltransferase
VFLKQRQRYRAYGLSILESDVPRFLRGPRASRFMQFEYEVADRDGLRNVLPEGAVSLRVQTIPENDHEYRRFAALHSAFGQATGLPVLVNTSFNGFSEPIVCSPRDAIRVFFGTGIDMLVLDRFVVRK